jgi:glycogen synthase
MKILMTTDPVGGVWQYTAELVRELDRAGHHVVVASLGGRPTAAQRAELQTIDRAQLYESGYRLEWMRSPWSDLEKATRWLDSLLDIHCPDLLHFNCYGLAARHWPVPSLLVTHSCVRSWWRAVHAEEPGVEWMRYRACVARALANSSRIIAPTRGSLAAMRECYPEVSLSERASVIYNGIDGSRWPRGEPSEAPFVLGVGRVWDQGKNLQALAAAAEHLSAPVLIAGEGHIAGGTGARGALLLGQISRPALAHYYRRASIFAHPARYEPFGLVVLEAALSGCALVLGDIPTLRELWEDAAVFVPPEDSAALREALQRLLDRPAERHRLGRGARRRALLLSARAMAAAYLVTYRAMLREPMPLKEGAA